MRILACAITLLLTPIAAAAGQNKELADALSLVNRTRFEEALPMLVNLLYADDLGKRETAAARIALAKCYFYTGQVKLSSKELVSLLKKQPKFRLDAKSTSPDFREFFDEVREGMTARGRPKEPQAQPLETKAPVDAPQVREKSVVVVVNKEQPSSQPASAPAPAVPTVPTVVAVVPAEALAPRVVAQAPKAEYHPGPGWARWMPMGIGQFSNKDYVGGAVFLSLTVALAAANVVVAILAETRVDRVTNQYATGTPFGLYVAQQATAAAAYAALIAGTIDALAFSPARARAAFEAQQP